MDLNGQTVLVTGASRGVGRSIAVALAQAGATVFGGSRDPDSIAWPEGVYPVLFDVSTPELAEQSWRVAGFEAKPISILVNNAGSGVFGAFESTEFADWRSQIELMLLAPMRLCQLALPGIAASGSGAIVNVGSLATEFPIPYLGGYNAAKAGLAGFTESLLAEVNRKQVRVLELRLGDLNTRFNDHVARRGESPRLATVWRAMEKHVASAPTPDAAARRLVHALQRDECGLIRAGGFFQTVVASLFGRLVSPAWKRRANLRYYNLND